MANQSKASAGTKATTKLKNMNEVINGERYRTDLAYLIASDEKEGTFLFRSVSSLYFVQTHREHDSLQPLPMEDAEALYLRLPMKNQSLVASFPTLHGGVGMDTPTKYDDE